MSSVHLYVSRNALPPSQDDQQLAAALARRGASVQIVAWDDRRENWPDLGIICSTWDYTTRFAEFSAWLPVAARHCALLNPLPLLRRSIDKRYLLDLAESGVPTIPTKLCSSRPEEIRAAALDEEWHHIVLKPLVSAGGRHVLRSTPDAVPDLPPPVTGAPEGWLVQPLLPGISQGEYSCTFIAGELSHTVLKRPATDEFRVQARFGGRTSRVTAPDEVGTVATRAVQSLGPDHLYARVDVVTDPDLGALIMEVEMVEPDLFLRFYEPASERLAEAALARL